MESSPANPESDDAVFERLNIEVQRGRISESARDGMTLVCWDILSALFWQFLNCPREEKDFVHLQGKAQAVVDILKKLNKDIDLAKVASDNLKEFSIRTKKVRQGTTAPGGT